MCGGNYAELMKYIKGVAEKRNQAAADRLKKGVDWYLDKQRQIRKSGEGNGASKE